MSHTDFSDDFDGPDLDTEVWIPHYLPMWSSRAASAASYTVTESELRLTIPPEHGLWCPGEHDPQMRVSGLQSGVFSGEVGSTVGQQPFRDGAVVREAQPTQWGWTPHYGRLEVRARMDVSPGRWRRRGWSGSGLGNPAGWTSSSTFPEFAVDTSAR